MGTTLPQIEKLKKPIAFQVLKVLIGPNLPYEVTMIYWYKSLVPVQRERLGTTAQLRQLRLMKTFQEQRAASSAGEEQKDKGVRGGDKVG